MHQIPQTSPELISVLTPMSQRLVMREPSHSTYHPEASTHRVSIKIPGELNVLTVNGKGRKAIWREAIWREAI